MSEIVLENWKVDVPEIVLGNWKVDVPESVSEIRKQIPGNSCIWDMILDAVREFRAGVKK